MHSLLCSVDITTGKPCEQFGDGGEICLDLDVRVTPGEWIDYILKILPMNFH